jgi:hypothetical protein
MSSAMEYLCTPSALVPNFTNSSLPSGTRTGATKAAHIVSGAKVALPEAVLWMALPLPLPPLPPAYARSPPLRL